MQKAFLKIRSTRGRRDLFRIEKRTENSKIPPGPKILKSGPNNIIFKKLLCVTKKEIPIFFLFSTWAFSKKKSCPWEQTRRLATFNKKFFGFSKNPKFFPLLKSFKSYKNLKKSQKFYQWNTHTQKENENIILRHNNNNMKRFSKNKNYYYNNLLFY